METEAQMADVALREESPIEIEREVVASPAPARELAVRREIELDAPWLLPAFVLAPIIALFVVYAAKHSFLCDDAYISFRYVRNLVVGHGLVFNLGERVEGYTNFLWVLELAALWKWLGVGPETGSLLLSALYTAGTLLITASLAQRTPFARQRLAAVACSLFLLAINRNFAVWTTSGLETRQFTFFVILAIWFMQHETLSKHRIRAQYAASLAWAAAELTRPEGVLLFACAAYWMLGSGAREGRLKLNAWIALVLPFAVVVGAQFAFRLAYYGDLFPNTYYAKDVQAWPEAGFRYLIEAIIEGGLYLVIPVALCGLYARLTLGRSGLHVLSALCILAHATYVVRIGGDHFEFRPFDLYWPLLAVATTDGLLWMRAGAERWLSTKTAKRAMSGSWFITGAFASVLVVYSTVLQVAHLTLTHDMELSDHVMGFAPKITKESFPAAFILPGIEGLTGIYNIALDFTANHQIIRYQSHKKFYELKYAQYGRYIGKTDGLFPLDAVMQYSAVGVVPYSLPDLTVIDYYGLTDRTIAHAPWYGRNKTRVIGHDRAPPPGYLEKRGVNLEVRPAERVFRAQDEYALRLEDDLWMPLWSPRPDWLRRAFASHGLWWKQLNPVLSQNRIWVSGRELRPVRALGFFDEPGKSDWTMTGENLLVQPAAGVLTTKPIGYVGLGLVASNRTPLGDGAVGSLSSPTFTPSKGDQLAFLVGGGGQSEVGVQLIVDGVAKKAWRGRDSEELAFVAYDLTPHAGHACRIRIYDSATTVMGHILADHFMLLH